MQRAVVLVVEDEPLLRMYAVDVFEDSGFATVEAGTADEAIQILETRLDIRIVFTDIDMPGSMDGLRLAAAIRDRWPPIEIIITSGHVRAQDVNLPDRAVFFSKPYDPDRVVAEMQRMAASGIN